jgi:Family of unknown function (DUF5996)
MNRSIDSRLAAWPSLPVDAARDLRSVTPMEADRRQDSPLTKPFVNHSWHTTLYVTATGFDDSVMPYGSRSFQINFNFLEYRLWLRSSDGRSAALALEPQSVASFYGRLMDRSLMLRFIPMPIRNWPAFLRRL